MNTDPKTTKTNNPSAMPKSSQRWIWVTSAVVLVLAGGGLLISIFLKSGSKTAAPATATVEEGPLTISVTADGVLDNREKAMVRSDVAGSTTILTLVDEGVTVKEGDLLITLDSSSLDDNLTSQEITVNNAQASLVSAQEDLAVTKSQAASDIAQAELTLRLANLDYDKYINGEYPQSERQAEADITISREELQRAKETLNWSRQLAQQGYITRTELTADELSVKKCQLDLQQADGVLSVLRDYTYNRDVEQLRSAKEQAVQTLDRVKRKASADIIQAEATLKARTLQDQTERAKYAKIKDQISRCRLVAPVGGMVVYATTGKTNWRGSNQEALAVRQTVRERQELIYIPTSGAMTATVKVHESSLRKIREDMRVRITVESLPEVVFTGVVRKIALLYDAQAFAENPDRKLYQTDIDLNPHPSLSKLRAGMSCKAEIIVEDYDKALYVPVQTVVRKDGKPTVYLMTPEGPEPQPIEIGLDNNSYVRVISGLTKGQQVLQAPPLEKAAAKTDAVVAQPDQQPDQSAATSRPTGNGNRPRGTGTEGRRRGDKPASDVQGDGANRDARPDDSARPADGAPAGAPPGAPTSAPAGAPANRPAPPAGVGG